MKLYLYFWMIILATCSGSKRATMGETTTDSIGQEAIRHDIGNDMQTKNQDVITDLTFIVGEAYSNIETVETLIITDYKALQKFYSRVNRTRKPGLPVPGIDFINEIVVAYCSGISNDESIPELYILEQLSDKIILGVRQADKPSISSAVTTPFAVYKLPHTEKEIIVQE